MRVVFVLTTVAVALALGVVAAALESRPLIRTLIVGIVPVMWAVPHVIERLTGRDMWHLSAPYPYRRVRHRGDTTTPQPNSYLDPVAVRQETDDRSTVPLAA
jgi:hypothetical protein